jgi:hypothetical protein
MYVHLSGYSISNMIIKTLILVTLLSVANASNALVTLQQLSIPSSIEFETNPLYLESNEEESITRYTTSPTYKLSLVEGVNRWTGSAALRIQRSSDKDISVDREDPLLSIAWDREFEKGSFRLFGNYEKNSILVSEFRRTGLVNIDGDSTTKLIGAALTKLLSERLELKVGANFLNTAYTSGSLIDFSTQSLDSTLSYDINEKINAFATLGYNKFKPDDETGDQDVKLYLAGANFKLSPRASITAAAGRNKVTSSGYSTIGNVRATYLLNNHTFQGSFERTTSPTGNSNIQRTDTASLIYSCVISNVSRLGSNASWLKSNGSVETYGLGGFYERDISDRWQMRMSLVLGVQKDDIRTVKSEVAGFYIIYNTPEF